MGKNHKTKQKKRIFGAFIICVIALEIWALIQGEKNEETENEAVERKEESYFPEIALVKNALILAESPDGVTVYYEGSTMQYPWQKQPEVIDQGCECCIADLLLSDEAVAWITRKKEKVHGIVQSWDGDSVVVENYGTLKLTKDYRGYRVYGIPEEWDLSHLMIGYDFADFVIENGEICGILYARDEPTDLIRVLIRTDHYEKLFHEKVILCGEEDLKLQFLEEGSWKERILPAGEELRVARDNSYWEVENQRIRIIPGSLTGRIGVVGLKRESATQWYHGELELLKTAEGLVLINVLPLEEYLYFVVPSEMPASYPMEALKAQAICARTYALGRIKQAAYPALGAHLDDSTMFQVYHNIPSQEQTTDAVKSTYGRILATEEGKLAETYYYSTSCGWGTGEEVWGIQEGRLSYLSGKKIGRQEVREFLQDGNKGSKTTQECTDDVDDPVFLTKIDENDYEKDENWYRWSYLVEEIDLESFGKRLEKRCREKTEEGMEIHSIKNMEVIRRGQGGAAVSLAVETDAGDFHVDGEYGIREVLCDGRSVCKCGNGGESICNVLLPSSFFLLEPRIVDGNMVGYTLIGGGLGHGVGMSQNGARQMAMDGLSAEEILKYFFEGCKIISTSDIR